MVFSSLNFLFFFLPIVLLAHWAAPGRFKNVALLIASLWFYAWGEPVYIVLMLLSVAFNYLTARQLGEISAPGARRTVLASGIAVNLLLLGTCYRAGVRTNVKAYNNSV